VEVAPQLLHDAVVERRRRVEGRRDLERALLDGDAQSVERVP